MLLAVAPSSWAQGAPAPLAPATTYRPIAAPPPASQAPPAPVQRPPSVGVTPTATTSPTVIRERPPRFDHQHQTSLAVMPGVGFEVVVPYKTGTPCGDKSGDDGKYVCTGNVPLFVDLQFAFGASESIDLIFDLRLGLVKDTIDRPRQFGLAPGLRFWLDPELMFKFYTTLQGVFESQGQNNSGVSNTDFGIRNANGFMYDPIRNVGFYVQVAETIGLKRWFRISIDVGLGVQVRFP